MPIPQTRTRLKFNVTLRTAPGGIFQPDPSNLGALTIVGAASKLTINQERDTNNFRREFNPALLGKPAETYPGLPKYSVDLERVDLYDANLLEAFGVVGNNIIDQFKPLIIVAEQPVPEDAAGNPLVVRDVSGSSPMKRRTYIVLGCWIDKLPVEFDATADDQKFVLATSLIAQDVIVS